MNKRLKRGITNNFKQIFPRSKRKLKTVELIFELILFNMFFLYFLVFIILKTIF